MHYDAVLYDLDGTLVDTIPAIMKAFRKAFLEVTGKPAEDKFILSTIGLPLRNAFVSFPEPLQEYLYEACRRYSAEYVQTMPTLFPKIREDLEDLSHRQIRQGVVTSKRAAPAAFVLEKFGLRSFFEVIVTADCTARHKPYPDPLKEAMQQLGLDDPSRVLYVGDSVHDLRCANAAGMPCAMVNWTYMPKEELESENPRFWINRLADIPCIIVKGEL